MKLRPTSGRSQSAAPVVLFTLGPNACATCHWVARWLRQRGISFLEVDVSVDGANRRWLEGVVAGEPTAPSDPLPVPTLVLGDGTIIIWPSPSSLEATFR